MSKVIAVTVHPDDETLGCGGTLLWHKNKGDEIYWLIITDIEGDDRFSVEMRENRIKEIPKVAQAYSFDRTINLGLKPGILDVMTVWDLTIAISKVFQEVKPEIVYLPFKGDVHSDHKMVFNAAYNCTKSFRYPFVKKVLMMEVMSETDFAPSTIDFSFQPNLFVDITPYLKKKIEIMRIFESEFKDHPFPRSAKGLEAQAIIRGTQAGVEYAEAFVLLKEIID